MPKIVILGAGSHARVVLDCLRALGRGDDVLGMIEADGDRARWGKRQDGCLVLGGIQKLRRGIAEQAVLGYGGNARRGKLLTLARKAGLDLPSVVHPHASVSPFATLKEGAVILAGAVVVTGAKIGAGAIVNTGATVDHDAVLGTCVHVAPGAHLAGTVRVGDRAWIGIGASVRERIRIGADAIVGAGAAVVDHVPKGWTVLGVPARKHLVP